MISLGIMGAAMYVNISPANYAKLPSCFMKEDKRSGSHHLVFFFWSLNRVRVANELGRVDGSMRKLQDRIHVHRR